MGVSFSAIKLDDSKKNKKRFNLCLLSVGHLSYRQMDSVREVLSRVGTWDVVRLHAGGQLKGDYQGCQYIALNRDETDTLEFSRVKNLSPDLLLSLLGHTPQVSGLHQSQMCCQETLKAVMIKDQQGAV